MSNQSIAKKTYDLKTATSFVIASMIGVGVFTSLGYQVQSTDTVFSIMLLWTLGGIAAFTGAMSYVALAMVLPRSGGEYHYLSKIYGPALGYITGLLTVIVGFSAPIAASAMALDSYAGNLCSFSIGSYPLWGVSCILLVSIIHLLDVKKGGDFNFIFTAIKVVLIIAFISIGLFFADHQTLDISPSSKDLGLIMSSGFGVSLVYVTYSYTGWNAAVYVLDEIKNPKRNVPLAILAGTSIVTIIYILINFVFLYTTPMEEIAGKIDVADIAGQRIFGPAGAKLVSGLIAFGLISTISSMVVSASRVIKRMGEDYKLLNIFTKTSKNNVPYFSLIFIAGLALLFILTFTFEAVIEFAGFILSFFGLFTVLGLFILKKRNPELELPFGKWFFPIVPAIYLLIKLMIITYLIADDPNRIWHAIVVFGGAYCLYFFNKFLEKGKTT